MSVISTSLRPLRAWVPNRPPNPDPMTTTRCVAVSTEEVVTSGPTPVKGPVCRFGAGVVRVTAGSWGPGGTAPGRARPREQPRPRTGTDPRRVASGPFPVVAGAGFEPATSGL